MRAKATHQYEVIYPKNHHAHLELRHEKRRPQLLSLSTQYAILSLEKKLLSGGDLENPFFSTFALIAWQRKRPNK